jgi:hypothetical protein
MGGQSKFYNGKDRTACGCFVGTICLGVGIGACIVGGPVGLGVGIPLIICGVYLTCRNKHGCASDQEYMRYCKEQQMNMY